MSQLPLRDKGAAINDVDNRSKNHYAAMTEASKKREKEKRRQRYLEEKQLKLSNSLLKNKITALQKKNIRLRRQYETKISSPKSTVRRFIMSKQTTQADVEKRLVGLSSVYLLIAYHL